MVGQRTGVILRQMQALLTAGTFSGLSDRQLLERFLERRDEVSELAFAVLVERHGPMVLGVCRRIVGDLHDADDAFQATFVVLARRARSIHVEGSLGRWLFGVATRVATRARSDDRRRRLRERSGLEGLDVAGPEAHLAEIDRAEIQALIAQEIAGLPAPFQAPVLLCDLQGTSCEEAARRLGWPVGTVKSRLWRARARLRERLTRRGLTPADLSIVTAMWRAAPPPSLVAATTRAALTVISGPLTAAGLVPASVATLTQGVLRTMTYSKIKLAAATLMVVATGSAALLGQVSPQQSGARANGPVAGRTSAKATASPESDDQVDLDMLERAWIDAINRHDVAVVNRILAGEFEGIDQAGNPFDKPAALRDLLRGAFITDSFAELEEVKARGFGDTGVVTSRFKVRDSAARGSMTHVYVRRRGRWQCVASHASWATGGVCPAVGPIAEINRSLESAPVGRFSLGLSDAMASNCLACHAAVHTGKLQPPQAPAKVQPRLGLKAEPGAPLRVAIDHEGNIRIEGQAIAAEKKALEERLRVARVLADRMELVVSAAADTPFRAVEMVAASARLAGFQDIRFTPSGNDDKNIVPTRAGTPREREPRR
jgi:RNA polymerase sigma factor (sigma-70 family)